MAATGLCIAVRAYANVARYLGEKLYKHRITITNAIMLTIAVMVIIPLTVYIFRPDFNQFRASSVITSCRT